MTKTFTQQARDRVYREDGRKSGRQGGVGTNGPCKDLWLEEAYSVEEIRHQGWSADRGRVV